MKTKLKNLFFLAAFVLAAGLVFSSCATDPRGNEDDNTEYESAYFSIRLFGGETRAGETPGELEDGTVFEQMVNGIYVLLYDKSGNLNYGWNYDVTNIGADNASLVPFENVTGDWISTEGTTDEGQMRGKGHLVKAKSYDLVIVANAGQVTGYNSTFDNDQAAGAVASNAMYNTLTALKGVQTVGITTLGSNATGGLFYMSNANGPVPVTIANLKATAAAAETSPVFVNIDRALAKIFVLEDDDMIVTDGTGTEMAANVTSFQWKVNNYNTKSYLLRQYAQYSPEFPAGTAVMEEYATSILASRKYIYATDPNMTSGVTADFASEAASARVAWGDTNFKYMTENTFDLGAQTHADIYDYATYLDIEAKILFTGDAFTGTNGYYSFNNGTPLAPSWVIFTWPQAKEWYANDDFPDTMSNLKAAIKDLIDNSKNTGVFDFQTATDPTDPGTADQTIVHKSEPTVATNNVIYYHPAGLNIYRLLVKHFGVEESNNPAWGYYGVVRNNVYKLNVTEIVGPGTTTAETGYLAADITINPWYIRPHDVVINPER